MLRAAKVAVLVAAIGVSLPIGAQTPDAALSDSVTVRIQDLEISAAVQILSRYLDRPVIFAATSQARVTLETPRPIPRTEVVRLLRGLTDSHGLEMLEDSVSGTYRIRNRPPPRPEPSASPPARARAPGQPELFVLPLQHVRADEVARTISSLFGIGGGDDSRDAARPSTLGAELRENLVPPVNPAVAAQMNREGRIPGSLVGTLTVVPDARANTLLIRAERSDFELIKALIEQVDVRPLQVLIEVLIAEVRHDRAIGVNVEGTLGETAVGGTNLTVAGAIGAQGLGDFALQVMGIGGTDATATLSMSARRGDVRILSRPVILAANNESASILVGSQRPFVQVQRALPTDGATRDQVVQYKEVGTRLTVRPAISADGSVHLDVTQEISSATAETAFDAPVISSRTVQTQLLVRDGQTIVLGGLADRQRESNRQGIPFLSAIPLIGGLFGSAERRTTETELFVFLTPRVIRTDDDAMRLSTPIKERLAPDP